MYKSARYATVGFAIAIIVMCFVPIANVGSTARPEIANANAPFHIASAGPATGYATNAGVAAEAYDEQIGETFAQSFTSLAYNVSAVAQQDQDGFGPAYLLNGLSSAGYWYQIGLSWNWAELSGGYDAGFHANYNVFNSGGTVVLPTSGDGGLAGLSGTVNQGDTVELSLKFSGGNVVMSVLDWNTGASAQESFSAEGATQFVGVAGPANSNGFFTGIMTEQYHSSEYTGSEQEAVYTDTTFALSSAYLWIDEYDVNTRQSQFGSSSTIISFANPTALQTYSLDGATIAANATVVLTGSISFALNSPSSTISQGSSIQVAGTARGQGSASISVVGLPIGANATLSTNSITLSSSGVPFALKITTTYATPSGTFVITVSSTVSGSTSVLLYTLTIRQAVPLTVDYSVQGGGSGYSAPTLSYVYNGTSSHVVLQNSQSVIYADQNSTWSVSPDLSGSTTSERWETNQSASGSVVSAATINFVYFHQFLVTFGYSVSGGGTGYSGPTVNSVQFGQSLTPTTGQGVWVDAGSQYSYSNLLLGSTNSERWATQNNVSGIVSSSTTISPTYTNQYYLTLQSNDPSGGILTPSSEWVNAGTGVSISSNASTGWQFEFWTGSGSGSYSGGGNSTTIGMQAPITENATFYPGISIGVSGSGSVSYSYDNLGAQKATNPVEIFVPPGTNVTLEANPSSFLYKLNAWTGSATGTSSQTSVNVTEPSTITANFGYNIDVFGIIGVIAAVILCAVALTAVRRPKPAQA